MQTRDIPPEDDSWKVCEPCQGKTGDDAGPTVIWQQTARNGLAAGFKTDIHDHSADAGK